MERPLWPSTPDPLHADSAESKATFSKLDSITLPRLKFEKNDISLVLDYLTTKSKELDPHHQGVSFRLDLPMSPKLYFHSPPITFSCDVTDTSLSQILLWLEEQTDLKYRVDHGVIVFSAQPPTKGDTSLPVLTEDGPLAQISGECVSGHYDVPGSNTPEGKRVNEKLNSIVIAEFSYKKQDIAVLLQLLSRKSKELDPEHVGIQIELNLMPIQHTIGHAIYRELTADIGTASLARILAIICNCSGTGYSIEKGVVVVRPLITK